MNPDLSLSPSPRWDGPWRPFFANAHGWAAALAVARMAGQLGNVYGSGAPRRTCPHCRKDYRVTKKHRCKAKRKRTGREASFRQNRRNLR